MSLSKCNLGLAITGSFCTFSKIKKEVKKLADKGVNIVPIFSNSTMNINSRFGCASEFVSEIENITGNEGMKTISQAEPIGPNRIFDVLLIAPCTGNTMAKLCNGITDTPVLMAAKAHMRNGLPIVISMSTNDALGINFKNIGMLLNMKNVYFVPFGQDNSKSKPNSMIAHVDLIEETLEAALEGKQLQPLIRSPFK